MKSAVLLLFLAGCGTAPRGADGASCVVSETDGGTNITCGSSSAFVANATNVEEQPFCPSLGGGTGFQEMGLRIGTNVYAVYYDGKHTFLTKLTPGTYVTTDGRNCMITVNEDGTIDSQ